LYGRNVESASRKAGRKKRFIEEQIIGVLKEAEAGMKVDEVCRKYSISGATYYISLCVEATRRYGID